MTVFHRREYERGELNESSLDPNPFVQFEKWLTEAVDDPEVDEPYAMTVATVGPDSRPSARVVLLRGADENGFVFFTNYESDKGHDLEANPAAAIVFYWSSMERQVRIEGIASKVSDAESDRYFQSRPHMSRLGALASQQSKVIAGRDVLEERLAELVSLYPDGTPIPRPPQWGGYRVVPDVFEFWHGRPSRLHDRLRYRRADDGWMVERLAP